MANHTDDRGRCGAVWEGCVGDAEWYDKRGGASMMGAVGRAQCGKVSVRLAWVHECGIHID